MTRRARLPFRISTRPLAVLLLLIGGLVAFDVLDDHRVGVRGVHLVGEILTTILAGVGVTLVVLDALAARVEARVLKEDLHRIREEAAHWRQEAESSLRGLGVAIDHQFQLWELTPAEREVGLLLLKGLAIKEIAAVRESSERTVRQQTLAIYRKANLSGRAELAAFFLEDLLLPGTPAPEARQESSPG